MAASAKVLTLDSHALNEEWTVVLPRNGKRNRKVRKIKTKELQQQAWVPTDLEFDPDGQSKLIQKLQVCVNRMESSQFYQNILEQIQTPEILEHFHSVLGLESKMQMVIYGIGSIDSYEVPRFQLSLAILLKRNFDWIGEIEVFDPILSATESQVLEAFGCSVLSINEQGRRRATKPTLFYMPHCEAGLYDNLLQANWEIGLLNRIVLFGNSFKLYEFMSEFKSFNVINSQRHVLAAQEFMDEFEMKTIPNEYYISAFHDSSWHFFSPGVETQLQLPEN